MFAAVSVAWAILSFLFAVFLTLALALLCLIVAYIIVILVSQMFNKSEDD